MKFDRSRTLVKRKLLDLQEQEPISLAYVVLKPKVDPETGNISRAEFNYGFAGHMTRRLSAGVLKSIDDLKEAIIKKWLQAS